jgi:hypothetical protein
VQKAVILEALRRQGLDARADWVDRTLPDDIDLQRNVSLLDTLGLDADALAQESSKRPENAA